TLPIRNLHIVPQGVADDEAVFVEPLAAAFQILEQVPVSASDTAVVLGDGKLGNLCAQVLTMTGCALIVAGKHPEKLKLLAARGIETATYDSPLPRADVVVEATGSSAGLGRAIELARPRGVVVMKSTVAGESCLALAPA